MRYLIFLVVAVLLPFTLPHHGSGEHHCLSPAQVDKLISSYFGVFTSTNPPEFPALVAALFTPDITWSDETINFGLGPCLIGPEDPVITSHAAFVASLTIRLATSTINDEHYNAYWVVHDCENISMRWQGTAKAKGNIPNKYSDLRSLTRVNKVLTREQHSIAERPNSLEGD
jgi:hypothetical protein